MVKVGNCPPRFWQISLTYLNQWGQKLCPPSFRQVPTLLKKIVTSISQMPFLEYLNNSSLSHTMCSSVPNKKTYVVQEGINSEEKFYTNLFEPSHLKFIYHIILHSIILLPDIEDKNPFGGKLQKLIFFSQFSSFEPIWQIYQFLHGYSFSIKFSN